MQDKIQQIFSQVDYAINNNQFAAAVAALCSPKSKRQFLTVPSGMGKSRIIAAVLALKNMMEGTQHFTIVFTTSLLRSVDQKVYSILQRLLDIQLDLVVFDSRVLLQSQIRRGDYVIIDEADQVLLDYQEDLSHPYVLALSATPFAEQKVDEQDYLERLNFALIDSKIGGAIDWRNDTEVASVQKFFKQSAGFARLIYDTDDRLESPPTAVTLTDCKDLERLKMLTSQDVVLITDATLARGVDYRAADGIKGLALLVMSSSQSERAYIQLLGRVGRYREPCLRFVWDELDEVICCYDQATLFGKLRNKKTARRHHKQQDKQVRGQTSLNFGQR